MLLESIETRASGAAMIAAGGSRFLVNLGTLEALGFGRPVALAELDDHAADILALAAEAYAAELKGAALLARAEQSASMLEAKLLARGHSARAVRLALGRLATSKLLDDARFASAYVAACLARRAEGPRSLAAALARKGVATEVAKAAIAGAFEDGERRENLGRAVSRLTRHGFEGERLDRKLKALGYSSRDLAEYREVQDDADRSSFER